MTEAKSREWRKRLTAVLLGMPSVVLIDNLREPARLRCGPRRDDRRDLEKARVWISRRDRAGCRCMRVGRDGRRNPCCRTASARCVSIRSPASGSPWLRDGFRHADLTAWRWSTEETSCGKLPGVGSPMARLRSARRTASLGTFGALGARRRRILAACDVSGFPFDPTSPPLRTRPTPKARGWRTRRRPGGRGSRERAVTVARLARVVGRQRAGAARAGGNTDTPAPPRLACNSPEERRARLRSVER